VEFHLQASLAEIESRSSFSALALQRYQFPEQWKTKALSAACKRKGISTEFVGELVKSYETSVSKEVFSHFAIPVIVDYLCRTHQLYLTKKLPEIEQSLTHLVYGYQEKQPYLLVIKALFDRYKMNLIKHIDHEEKKFLPHVLYVCDHFYRGACKNKFYAKVSKYSVNTFINQHDDTEAELNLILKSVKKYAPAQMEASLFRVLKEQITALEYDLHIHAIIEDEVLVPKALAMEKSCIGNRLNFRLGIK